jgi:gas vesicle protein
MILPNEKRKKLEELLFAVSPEGKKLESYQALALGVKEKINSLSEAVENAVDKKTLSLVVEKINNQNKETLDLIKVLSETLSKNSEDTKKSLQEVKEKIDKIEKEMETRIAGKWWGSWGVNFPSPAWGSITGVLSNQTDLQTTLDGLVSEEMSIAYSIALG